MIYRLAIIFFLFTSFQSAEKDPFIVVLGITQDAGYPQIGCDKECCKKYWDKKLQGKRFPVLHCSIHQQINNGYLMSTFYKDGELPVRNMAEVPHPFLQESLQLFEDLPATQKQKIYFIQIHYWARHQISIMK